MNKRAPRINRLHSVVRLCLAIGLVAICQASTALAQSSTTKPAGRGAASTRPTVKASVVLPQLEQMYNVLGASENDYQGHRDLAMKEIAGTAQLLGKKLAPPKNIQKGPLSDLQVRSVQMVLLEIGRSVPAGDNNAPVVAHLNGAINELAQGINANRAQGSANTSSASNTNSGATGGHAANNATWRGPIIIDNPIGTNMVEVGALEDIYQTLSFANHDYKGHRIKAMKAISRVVTALGASIQGDGRGHEQQIVSDQQLHYAQFLLHQVCQSFTQNDPKAILADLTTADNELTTALQIR
jgi:hypothetical protein